MAGWMANRQSVSQSSHYVSSSFATAAAARQRARNTIYIYIHTQFIHDIDPSMSFSSSLSSSRARMSEKDAECTTKCARHCATPNAKRVRSSPRSSSSS
mmetsp:Transcript_2415/g.7955  ORF Transcript_2415/g.7955 Transcript_2415/m.7955 type:complete len:99 (-) Transcript_2415:1262-1558(-)